MTDAEYKTQCRRIDKLAKKWIGPMGLAFWDIDVICQREEFPVHNDGTQALATSAARWQYLHGTITFSAPGNETRSDDQLENTFVHELCHVLVNEMRMWATEEMAADKNDEGMHHEERVVSQMTAAFLGTRAAGKQDKRIE